MKRKNTNTLVHAWMAFPLLLLVLAIVCIRLFVLPVAGAALHEGKNLYLHYMKKRDAAAFPLREKRVREENRQIDSVLQSLRQRNENRNRSFIDALYSYADSSGFTAGKVEAGIAQPVGNHREVSISIDGTGSYRATGRFLEQIENSPHSTRVRQLIVKEKENRKAQEVFIEVVLLAQ